MFIGIFRWYGMVANIVKSKAMTCQPGAIWSGMLEDTVGRRRTGRGETYKERLRRWIPCQYYGVDIIAVSIAAHMRKMHGKDP